jgi:hypothetical protein
MKRKKQKEEKDRERRIADEITVDCYNEDECAMSWHVYLEDNLKCPFQAECIEEIRGSPLRKKETVKVVAVSDSEFCLSEVFVDIEWGDRIVAVPLVQLLPVKATKKTIEAIGDWHYWKRMGRMF